jgi:hypothetical protein
MIRRYVRAWVQWSRPPAPLGPRPEQIEAYQARERELVHEIFRLSGPSERYKEAAWLLALVVDELRQRPVEQQGTMYLVASSFVRNHCLECGAEKDGQVYDTGSRFCGICARVRLGRHRQAEPDNIDRCLPFGFEDADHIW